MLIPSRDSGFIHPHSSEITPRSVYRIAARCSSSWRAVRRAPLWLRAGREAMAPEWRAQANWQRWRVPGRSYFLIPKI